MGTSREGVGPQQDKRSGEAHAYRRLYKTQRWQDLRAYRLVTESLCRICQNEGRITPATTVDHIEPHKGNAELFFNFENTQSLCSTCHNSAKQSEERLGYSKAIGQDGWPMDKRHPVNSRAGR